MVRKILAAMLAAALLAVFVLPAFAETEVRYVDTDKLKVYSEPNKSSKVLQTLKGGKQVRLMEDLGDWCRVLVQLGGEKPGFVETKYLSYTIPQRYCKHNWTSWEVITEPTCTKKGMKTRGCTICGMGQAKDIKATGHKWGKWKVQKEATCTKKGKRTRTCKVCGNVETEEYYAEHEYGRWITTREPTCSQKGLRERTCEVCGKVDEQSIDKLPHDYEWEIIVEATDHSAGKRAKVCSVCGYETEPESFDPEGTLRRKDKGEDVRHMQQLLIEQSYLNDGGADGIFGGGTEKALMQYQKDRGLNPDGIGWPQTLKDLEHDFGPWTTVQEMTRGQDGIRERVCQGCGFKQTETISSGSVFVKGDRGESVRAMQQVMDKLGYAVGKLDGIYGKKLDAAMAEFAKTNGLIVEKEKIRPAEVDAVVNAWLAQIPAEQWKGEGDSDSAVNLALTVTPSGEADENGIATYSWSVTNLGDADASFTALLLTFGNKPDFRKDNLVMQLDGVNLKKNSGNSASGSFSADANWGEGKLNFAALAIDEKTDDIWLSNAVDFENSTAPSVKTVAPMDYAANVNALSDGEYPVAFNPGDVLGGASGIFMNAVHIFSMDVYAADEVDALAAGDTLVVCGEEIAVKSVEFEDDWVVVNGEVTLVPMEAAEDGYRVFGDDDAATYSELGVTTLTLDPSAVYNDSSNLEEGTVSVGYDGIVNAVTASDNPYFNEYNTAVRIENGKVVEINRVYVP